MPNQTFQNAGDLTGGAPEMQENRAEAKKKMIAISVIRCDFFFVKCVIQCLTF